jgi:hypothetical protein
VPLPFSQFQSRALLAAAALSAALAVSWCAARWYMVREWRRSQIQYRADTEREYRNFEKKLREQINLLHRAGGDVGAITRVTDRIFELLRESPVAAKSREVASWRGNPPSPERTDVALRWAEVVADECRFYAALHATWKRDYERGGMGHRITDDEVPPFRMPAGWITWSPSSEAR